MKEADVKASSSKIFLMNDRRKSYDVQLTPKQKERLKEFEKILEEEKEGDDKDSKFRLIEEEKKKNQEKKLREKQMKEERERKIEEKIRREEMELREKELKLREEIQERDRKLEEEKIRKIEEAKRKAEEEERRKIQEEKKKIEEEKRKIEEEKKRILEEEERKKRIEEQRKIDEERRREEFYKQYNDIKNSKKEKFLLDQVIENNRKTIDTLNKNEDIFALLSMRIDKRNFEFNNKTERTFESKNQTKNEDNFKKDVSYSAEKEPIFYKINSLKEKLNSGSSNLDFSDVVKTGFQSKEKSERYSYENLPRQIENKNPEQKKRRIRERNRSTEKDDLINSMFDIRGFSKEKKMNKNRSTEDFSKNYDFFPHKTLKSSTLSLMNKNSSTKDFGKLQSTKPGSGSASRLIFQMQMESQFKNTIKHINNEKKKSLLSILNANRQGVLNKANKIFSSYKKENAVMPPNGFSSVVHAREYYFFNSE